MSLLDAGCKVELGSGVAAAQGWYRESQETAQMRQAAE